METKNNKYILYAHYLPNSDTVFYIGEGRPGREKEATNRNRYWHFKVAKYGGFESEILISDTQDKQMLESIEAGLIQSLFEDHIELVNLSIGPAFTNHWSSTDITYDKTKHPMYGKKFPNGKASKRMSAWNKKRTGTLSPTYGKRRPDLAGRNKHPELIKHFTKPVVCVELGRKFKSTKEALEFLKKETGLKNPNINRALDKGSTCGGYHWKRI